MAGCCRLLSFDPAAAALINCVLPAYLLAACMHLLPQRPQEGAARALLGLPIALQHPTLSSSPQVLCAAARSCKAWKEAVQQCSVRNTAVVLDVTKPLQQLHSFCRWLPKHAALVRAPQPLQERLMGAKQVQGSHSQRCLTLRQPSSCCSKLCRQQHKCQPQAKEQSSSDCSQTR
jgi:hypothetical protein